MTPVVTLNGSGYNSEFDCIQFILLIFIGRRKVTCYGL